MTENQTRTIVTVHTLPDDVTVCYDADNYATDARGELDVLTGNDAVARWAPGTWQRVEVTEETLPIEDSAAAPEEPAGTGTFEVYEDAAGQFRFQLLEGNGEVIASGQAYASRKGAHDGTRAVQRAAKGAPIVDVDQ